MVYNFIFAFIILSVLYLTYIQIFFPLLKLGQAETDILPTPEHCDSMATLFEGNTKTFAHFAEIDY